MSTTEAELRRGIAMLEQYRAQVEGLSQQQEIVRISLEEHMRGRETIARYQQAGPGTEVLVPVGAQSYLVGQVKDAERAFVGIGSDLVVYDSIPAQLGRLDARIRSISDAANAIAQRLADMQRRAEAQSAFVEDLYAQVQAAQGERT